MRKKIVFTIKDRQGNNYSGELDTPTIWGTFWFSINDAKNKVCEVFKIPEENILDIEII